MKPFQILCEIQAPRMITVETTNRQIYFAKAVDDFGQAKPRRKNKIRSTWYLAVHAKEDCVLLVRIRCMELIGDTSSLVGEGTESFIFG